MLQPRKPTHTRAPMAGTSFPASLHASDSQVGLITLVGLVSRNGILIVQFANHLQEEGRDKLHAVIEAAGTRLRPILMTNSIGIMLVSGMIIGSFFTLFVVPSIYVLVARTHRREEARELEVDADLSPATV